MSPRAAVTVSSASGCGALLANAGGSAAAGSMPLGEEVAISLLRDERRALRESFEGFSFTRFDGSRVTV